MRQLVRYLCAFALASILCSTAAIGQATSATLNGVVSDSGGLVVPGAQLSVRNIDTNLKQVTESSATGLYSISQLPPGRYTVTTQKDGFQNNVQTGIVLTVGQVATLHIALRVGDVNETVTVVANAELINVTTSEISTVVNQSSVEGLPLNGRDPSSLVLLTTGTMNILPANAGSAVGGGMLKFGFPNESGASSGGGRQGSTYYVLDGASNMDNMMALAAPFPNSDAIQEFRVVTENFDVQYGFSAGAVVNIRTKSGANAFHGGAFEFVRNNDLNAANFFSHHVDPLKRNQFGAFVGGPIRKDKLFFFANYQGTRMSSAATSNTTYTPTQAMLNGDFSAVGVTLPAPFVNNVMAPATWSALVTKPGAPGYGGYTFATTALPLGQDPATGRVTFEGPVHKTSFNEETGRLDYTVNDKQRLFLRSFTQYYNAAGAAVKGNATSGAAIANTLGKYYNEVFGHSWMVNNSTVNNLTLYYSQLVLSTIAQDQDKNGDPVCWSRYISVSTLPGKCALEALQVYGAKNGGAFYGGNGSYTSDRRTTWGISDQLIKTIQKHTLTVGVDLHKQLGAENSFWPIGSPIYFTGATTGFGWSDFLLGYASNFNQGAGEITNLKGWLLGIYVQEQYRVKPNVTLTAGVRWDPNLPPAMTLGRGAAFHAGQQSTIYPNAPLGVVFPGDAGVSSALMPNSYGYVQPRVGLTWQPGFAPHTAIRAGFGLFTGPFPYDYYDHAASIAPFSPNFTFSGGTALYPTYIPLANPWANLVGGNPFPPFASLTTKPPKNTLFQTPMSLGAIFSNNFKNSTTQSWSVSVEQQLSQSVALHVAYVGSQSYHQSVVVDQNPGCVPSYVSGCVAGSNVRIIEPNLLSQLPTIESAGTASYNSLQATIDKHMSHGIQAHSNFTWSKVMDIISEGDPSQGGSFNAIGNPYDLRANRSISDLNRPFISASDFTYTSPSLQGHNALVRNVLGAWGLSSIYTLQSGRPFGVSAGGSANNSGSLQQHDRANWVPGVSPAVHHGNRSQWLANYLNMNAFTNNAVGTFGNTSRNLFKTPYINSADTAISKIWSVHEQYKLQFRWELFNTFNHTSFDVPTAYGITLSDISASSSSKITSIGSVPPRVMQGALKLTF